MVFGEAVARHISITHLSKFLALMDMRHFWDLKSPQRIWRWWRPLYFQRFCCLSEYWWVLTAALPRLPLYLLTPLLCVSSSEYIPSPSLGLFLSFSLSMSLFLLPVPAQPSGFEAEAELDSRIMLSWLWPVQDPIIGFELLYWEASNPTKKVNTTRKNIVPPMR